MTNEEIMTRTATLAYIDGGGHNRSTRAPPSSSARPAKPAREGKGWRNFRAAHSVVPLCLLLLLSLALVSRFLPFNYKREGRAPH
jgi:hypothetical protein